MKFLKYACPWCKQYFFSPKFNRKLNIEGLFKKGERVIVSNYYCPYCEHEIVVIDKWYFVYFAMFIVLFVFTHLSGWPSVINNFKFYIINGVFLAFFITLKVNIKETNKVNEEIFKNKGCKHNRAV